MTPPRPTGMMAFALVWLGQVVSLFGSAMTRFAITIWAWQVTGQATSLALVGFFSFAPELAFSPFAGALIDRWNRKLVMMISDLAAGLATIALLVLYGMGRLEIWHLYVAAVLSGAGAAFQWPAYSAAITTMISSEYRGRANGMMILVDCLPGIFAPLAAGALLGLIGLSGIMAIDVATFVFAVSVLLVVRVPQPAKMDVGRGSLWYESIFGLRYVLARPGLFGLQLIFVGANAMAAFGHMLVAPMVLARTGNDSSALASVVAGAAVGEVLGGVMMSAWGGPRRKIHGTLIGWIGLSLLGHTVLGLGRGLPAWVAASFGGTLVSGLIGSSQAIWQSKVAPEVQGRVFGIRRMMELLAVPPALLLAGPLADRVFEPGMQMGGGLAPVFGSLVGVGPGAGLALLLILSGVLGALAASAGYLSSEVRNIESRLPDHMVVKVMEDGL